MAAVWLAATVALADGPPLDSPYLRPEIERLMDAVTLHVSFDAGSLRPDMAEGDDHAPAAFGTPEFADGLRGKALVLGKGGAIYRRTGNVPLEKRGALAVWVRPEGWQRPRDGNCVFTMTTNARFYLQRQGPDRDADGSITRHESVHYLVFLPGKPAAGLDAGIEFQNERWYLLVVNWSWPTMELSVDGGPMRVTSLAAQPADDTFGDLIVGDQSGQRRGLLDEVLVFRRPLTAAEAKLLYDAIGPAGSRR